MKRIYREVDVFPPLKEMLKEISKNESVSKEDVYDILSAISDGVSLEEAVQDFWKDALDGYMYRELVDITVYTDCADEAYDRYREERE